MADFIAIVKKVQVLSLATGDAEIELVFRGRLDKQNLVKLLDIYDASQEVKLNIESLTLSEGLSNDQ